MSGPGGFPLMKADDYELMSKLSAGLAKSGFFKDAPSAAQAFVKVMAGAELGLPPFMAMTAFHVVEGKPAPAANTYAAFIRRHPRYDYRVREHGPTVCAIEFFTGEKDPKSGKLIDPESLGVYRITLKDMPAALTGRANWKSYPTAMLFARAISQGCRLFAPDVFSGGLVYTKEELDDAREDVRDIAAQVFTPAPPGSDAELGQAEAIAAREGRELVDEEPEWDVTPPPAKPEVPRGPA